VTSSFQKLANLSSRWCLCSKLEVSSLLLFAGAAYALPSNTPRPLSFNLSSCSSSRFDEAGCWSRMACAVSRARRSGDVMIRSKRTVERWRAVVAAWRRPKGLRSVSSWPWTMPAAFSCVSPCLTTSILSLCGGIGGGDEVVIVGFRVYSHQWG
jgi:hypothetical protein